MSDSSRVASLVWASEMSSAQTRETVMKNRRKFAIRKLHVIGFAAR
jgi:hypothetical protein